MALQSITSDIQSSLVLTDAPLISEPHRMEEIQSVKKEGQFFIKLLRQAKVFAPKSQRPKMDELVVAFEQLLADEQPKIRKLILDQNEQIADSGEVLAIDQKWWSFKKHFLQLKEKAMSFIGEFFSVKIF